MTPRLLRAELANNVLAAGDDWAKVGKGKHLEPGIVAYDNEDGTRTKYLLPREGIAALRPSAVGKPIIGTAGGFDHMKVNAADAAKGKYDGDVVRSYDGGDGWEWIDFIVRDAATKEKCRDGYQFSCAYIPETDGQPGVWHNEPYDEKIIGGEYTHFAVVPNPRYEGATIELTNSKGGIVNKALKAVLSVLPIAQLKEIVNSIEDDAKKEDEAREKLSNAYPNLTQKWIDAMKALGGPADFKTFDALPGDEQKAWVDKAHAKLGEDLKNAKTDVEKKAIAEARVERFNAMKPDELHEHIIKNYAGELLSGEHSPELGALLEKGAKANKAELKDYLKQSSSDARMFDHGMKNAEVQKKKADFDEAMKNAKTDEERKTLQDAYNAAEAEPKEAPKADDASGGEAGKDAPRADAPKPPIGGGDVPLEPGLPGQEQAKPKANAEEAPEQQAARAKAALEKKNAEDAVAQKKADEEKAAAEKRNSLALKTKAEKDAKDEARRVERFNSLRAAAEERGGDMGSPFVGVCTTEEKQDLGRARYGS